MSLKSTLVVCALTALCLFSPYAAKADSTSITIQDADFSQSASLLTSPNNCGTGCSFEEVPPVGWSATPSAGVWAPSSAQFSSVTPNGETIFAYANGGTISQNLGVSLLPNSTYTLTVYVGNRQDAGLDSDYSFGLEDGSTTLASSPLASTGSITPGTFAEETLTFTTDWTVAPGDLTVFMSNNTAQASFGDVSLTVATPEPSSLLLLVIGLAGLLFLGTRFKRGPKPEPATC
jgi:PEP-CTERM motif